MLFKSLDKIEQMNIRLLLIAGICTLTVGCLNQKNKPESKPKKLNLQNQLYLPDSLSARRISFVLDLKKSIAEVAWPDFGKKNNEGTLIYFDSDRSEIFFPDSGMVKIMGDTIPKDNYYQTKRIDSLPYHMEVMISFNPEDSLEIFFKNPVEQYSSVEEIGQYIPVETTEMWATMVVHEMFHHFQYNNKNYSKYAESVIGILPFDSRDLVRLCREDEQFLSLIQNENKILEKALSESIKDSRDSLITSYLDHRNNRITKYSADNPYLEPVENYYIIQEGSARYIEYQGMLIFQNYFNRANGPLVKNDPKFGSFIEFKEIDFESDAFNYLVYAGPTDYHYTLGFNTMRLLDELKINYKNELLDNPEKGLHQHLEDYIKSL